MESANSKIERIQFSVIGGTNAYGCGGWERPDYQAVDNSDASNLTTFIFAPALPPDRLQQLEDAWDLLWLEHDGTLSAQASEMAASLGSPVMYVPSAARHAPVWDEHFVGTLSDFHAAEAAYEAENREHSRQVDAQLMAARVALLLSFGAKASSLYIDRGRTLVHDEGCRCGHLNYSQGDATTELIMFEGSSYLATPGADLQSLFAATEESAVAGERQALERNRSHIELVRHEMASTPTSWDKGETAVAERAMTFRQWSAHREEVATELEAAFKAEDWPLIQELVAETKYKYYFSTPSRFGANTRSDTLRKLGVQVLSDKDLAELRRALSL